jgi:hypothetical protein
MTATTNGPIESAPIDQATGKSGLKFNIFLRKLAGFFVA